MKGGKRRLGIEPNVFEQRANALAHLGRGFVRERNGKYRRRRHASGRHDVCDPMGDNARFSAAGAGENEQRTFGVAHRFALLRIEPFKKIHWVELSEV